MNRTKWMRLSVRDLGDVIRWAGAQNAREISEFRYRVVNGREIVSFRLVPRYAINIGAREIIVVAYARLVGWRSMNSPNSASVPRPSFVPQPPFTSTVVPSSG